MDKKYIELFSEITRAAETLAERVADLNNTNKDDRGATTAQIMRDDYAKLHDKLASENLDPNSLTKADYAKILVATLIVVSSIESRIDRDKKAVDHYKELIIPNLQKIVNESEDDEAASKLATEIFEIKQEAN